jgi:hypothetical protein
MLRETEEPPVFLMMSPLPLDTGITNLFPRTPLPLPGK